MKTTKSIVVVLFVLLTAQIASAYYCPSTGRWLSRDPIGEPGFQALQRVVQTTTMPPPYDRWINRDAGVVSQSANSYKMSAAMKLMMAANDPNSYGFVQNAPVKQVDNLGLFATLDTSGCKGQASDIDAAWKAVVALIQKQLDNNYEPTWDPSIFQRMSDDTQTIKVNCGGIYACLKCKAAGNPPGVIGLGSSFILCRDKMSPCLLAATLAVEASKVDNGVIATGSEIPFSNWLHQTMCPSETWK